MASDHNVPVVQYGTGEPISSANEGAPSGAGLQLTPGQESRDPFSSREGSPRRDGPAQAFQAAQSPPAQPAAPQTMPNASPSDLERGIGGYTDTRPELNLNTRAQSLGSGQHLPTPPPIIRGQTNEYDNRPRSNYSPRSQRDDPFSGSPNRSLGRQSNPYLPRSGSQNGSPSGPAGNEARDQLIGTVRSQREGIRGNEQVGGHLRHALEEERDRLVGRSQGHQHPDAHLNEGLSARLRHALEEDGDDLVNRIPGAHQDDAIHANEGFGARLRHAAEDYIHETFPNYNLPSLPGRLLHAGDDAYGTRRSRAMDPHLSRTHSVIDHVVPVQHVSELDMTKEKYMPGSVSARLHATVNQAETERDKYASKAKFTGLALNVAIGLQVLLGSLTTGLSAVATHGKSAAVSTTILGALSTVVASYLARARGSNEPELSITRVKDLEQFIRECKNFQTDNGEDMGHDYDAQIERFRQRFESLLGNANGERKLSSAGVQSHNANYPVGK